MKKRVALLNYVGGPQTFPLIGFQTSPLNDPKPLLLMGLKPLFLEAIHTRSHFIRSFVSDKPWDGNVPWLPHSPPTHTHKHIPAQAITLITTIAQIQPIVINICI